MNKIFITEKTTGLEKGIEVSVSEWLNISNLIKDYPEVADYIQLVVHNAMYLLVPEGEADLWYTRLKEAAKIKELKRN